MLSKFVTALQNADLDMTAEEIADTLWLALQMGSQQEEEDISHDINSPFSDNASENLPLDQQSLPPLSTSQTIEASASVHLHTQSRRDSAISYTASIPFRSPAASALPNVLALARALRPLMRRLPSKTAVMLNERATAQRIAETEMRLWIPVFDPAPVRWFDIELIVDIGASMLLWKETIAELQSLLEYIGAFRNVRIWRLATDNEDRVEIYAGTSTVQEAIQARNPKELINPGGYRLILVASDCISPAWHNGKVQELLDVWGQKNFVTLIQMLPRRLWPQTTLENADIVQIYSSQSGGSNRSLKIKKTLKWFDEISSREQFSPFPILTLEANSLSSWAHILTDTKKTWVTGAVFEQSLADTLLKEVSDDLDGKDNLSAKRRVQLFRTGASSPARRLAGLLAATPIPISLPVIRQVQSTMLPEASQVHVAEVFLGGLLEEIYRDETHQDPDQVQYDFIVGVRDELINTVPIPDAHQVLREISRFVQDRYGQPRDFLALIAVPQGELGQDISATKGTRPFARVELNALRRFGGAFIELIDELERHVRFIEEQQEEMSENISWNQVVLEASQKYSITNTANVISANSSFMAETWCGFSWAPWLPLNSLEIPTVPGIYRVRAVGVNEIFFIGSTGRNLRERIGDLYRNVMRDANQMPFSDPHTAAPALWAWRDATGTDFECSTLPQPSQADLGILVHYFLWQYRLERGSSTLANYGRSHPLYTKSSNRSTGRRGYRLPEGSSNSVSEPSLKPLQRIGEPLDRNWLGLDWSEYYPLASSDFKKMASSPAAYKVIDRDERELLLIGSTPNLRNRLQDLKQKNWNCSHPEVAFVLQSPDLHSYQLAELESDLLGGYFEQVKKAPKAQFRISPLDTETTTSLDTNGAETFQDTALNTENLLMQIPPGSHICQLYSKATEIQDITFRMIRDGLLASEKCTFIASSEQVKEFYERLNNAQLDANAFIASGQLVLNDEKEDLLVNDETFDPYYLLSSHLTFVAQALHEGWKGVRISIDMTWLSQNIATPEQIFKYEAISDAVFTFQNTPIIALIHYNHKNLLPSLVVEMLKLHPISMVGKNVKRNPYYLSYEQYMQKVLRIA